MTENKEYNKPDGVMAEAGISNNFYLIHVGREPNPNDPEDKGVKGTRAEMQVTLRWPNLWDSDSFDHYVGIYLAKKAMKGWKVKSPETQTFREVDKGVPGSAYADAERAQASGKGNPVPVAPKAQETSLGAGNTPPALITKPTGGTAEFPAEALTVEFREGKKFFKVKGGRYQKHGVTIWPEALEASGFTPEGLKPEVGTYDIHGYTAHYVTKEDGNPQKVVSLTR